MARVNIKYETGVSDPPLSKYGRGVVDAAFGRPRTLNLAPIGMPSTSGNCVACFVGELFLAGDARSLLASTSGIVASSPGYARCVYACYLSSAFRSVVACGVPMPMPMRMLNAECECKC